MASHHSASQWRTWIAQCEQSDLTVARFCQSIGVSVNTYYRWRQRLQREALALSCVPFSPFFIWL